MNRELQIRYSAVYKHKLLDAFLQKFAEDKTPFQKKLKFIGISKGTFSYLINAKTMPAKRTMEKMRAYLYGRQSVLHKMNRETQFFCSGCETVLPLSEQHHRDIWVCVPCKRVQREASKYAKDSINDEKYTIKNLFNGYTQKHLEKTRLRYSRKKYGRFAPAFRLLITLKKEIREYDKAINGSHRRNSLGNDKQNQNRQNEAGGG